MCHLDDLDSSKCINNRGSTVWTAVIIFAIGNFFRGVGTAIYYVIALPFMDGEYSWNEPLKHTHFGSIVLFMFILPRFVWY